MTVKEIIEKYLRENGYDGLFYEECFCEIDDLFPCDEDGINCELGIDCEPGYKQDCSKCIKRNGIIECRNEWDWCIGKEKEVN
ncbi:MAG: hypothetical protein Q8M94_14970 [Ignavibacteria bacterium]|nr:hypothetical protein [Ignavibacteria bacterium]